MSLNNSKWSHRFIFVGILQFIAIGVLTVFVVLSHLGPTPPPSTIMTYTMSEFNPGLWYTFGYHSYILGSIGVLVFGFVYRYVEKTSNRPYTKLTGFLAGFHLVFMNVGLVIATSSLMIAGWIAGIAMLPESYSGKGLDTGAVHNEIFMTMVPLGIPHWVGIWILIMSAGIIAGSIGLLVGLTKNRS